VGATGNGTQQKVNHDLSDAVCKSALHFQLDYDAIVVGITAREDDLAAPPLAETQITFAELNLHTQTD
jgi:hypothetical protein